MNNLTTKKDRLKNNEQSSEDLRARSLKIRDIYARARAKLQALKQERRAIVEDYVKKVDAARIEEARRRLKEL